MTDEEILKRLAEIEGYKLSEYGFRYSTTFNAIIHYQDDDFSPWNPLHDDAQCLALVKKYGLWISAPLFEGDEWGVSDYGGPEYKDISLNHAVCFAIIQDAGVT